MQTPVLTEEFADQVRDALTHLHDYIRLQSCLLCSLFFPSPSLEGPGRTQRFRRLLLETIEELSPPDQIPVNSKEWRGYHILSSRYVEGRDLQDVMQELAIGDRQFYREQRKAIDALARLMWEKYQWIQEHRWDEEEQRERKEDGLHTLRGEAGQLASQPRRIELSEIVEGVLRAVGPLAREKGLSISYHLGEGLPAVYSNRTLVRQILIQTLSWCIVQPSVGGVHAQFGRSGRLVDVQMTALASSGTRRGGPQAHSVNTAQELVVMVGGEWQGIDIGREQYHLQFSLPSSEPRLLLAIEDNPAAVRLLQRYLARRDYQVVGIPNGEDAAGLALDMEPDVIILDVMMPHRDGWEILETLRNNPTTKEIPVLVCSVLDEPQVASALGASAYLKKPFSQADLLDILSRLCGIRDGARNL